MPEIGTSSRFSYPHRPAAKQEKRVNEAGAMHPGRERTNMFDSTGDAPGEDACMHGSARELAVMPAQAIGKIQSTTGSVTVTRASGLVQGNVGDLVYQGDVIETAAEGAVAIIFKDGTAFNLSTGARMVLDEFVCDPDGTPNAARLSLARGMFNFIAGKVAKTGSLNIDTPFARIRSAAQGGGTGFVTLAALTFSVIQDIQAAILDDDFIEWKDLPHGTYVVQVKSTGETHWADNPGEVIQVDPAGTVTRIPLTSSQVAAHLEASAAAYGIQQLGAQAGVQQRADLQGAATGGSSGESNGFSADSGFLPPTTVTLATVTPASIPTSQPAPPSQEPILVLPPPPPPPPPPIGGVWSGAATEDVAVNPAGNLTSDGALNGGGGFIPQAGTPGSNGFGTFTLDAAGNWTLTANDFQPAIQQLAEGQVVTDSFTAGASDGTSQVITVTITGTNDAVSMTAAEAAGSVAEDAPATPSSTDTLNASGTINFTDVDLIDTHAAVVSASPATTLGTFSLDPVSEAAGAADGSVTWHYALNNAAAQLLAGQASPRPTRS